MKTYEIKAGSPEAANLALWWTSHVNQSGITIRFGPGAFKSKGLTIPPHLENVHVLGADVYRTRLDPDGTALPPGGRYFGLVGRDVNGCSVEDLTINAAVPVGVSGVSTGAYLGGQDNAYLNVRCVGVSSSGPPLEGFGLQLNGRGGQMKNVIVEKPSGLYVCGLTLVGEQFTMRKFRVDLGGKPGQNSLSGFAMYCSRSWASDGVVVNVATGSHQDGAGNVPDGTDWHDNVIRDSYLHGYQRTIRFAPVGGAQTYSRYQWIRNTIESELDHCYLSGSQAPEVMIRNFTWIDTTWIAGKPTGQNAVTPRGWNDNHVFIHNNPPDALRFTDPVPCHVIP